MKRILRLLVFTGMISSSAQGQTLEFDVIRNGSSMGITSVKRIFNQSEIRYELVTKTQFRILFQFEVEYVLNEVFQNGVLQNGQSFNTLNGSLQKKTDMSIRDGYYELIIDGIHTRVSEKEIAESVSEIYFEEPSNGKAVYSAYFARFLYFEKTGDHVYELSSPDGTNKYTYENGICIRVDITRDFASFSQVLKKEHLADVRNKKLTSSTIPK